MMIAHHPTIAVHHKPGPRVRVYGPAYLDRVLRVDAPLAADTVIDGSVEGHLDSASDDCSEKCLVLIQPDGSTLSLEAPSGWPGPWGRIRIGTPPGPVRAASDHSVRAVGWIDDLGGMGAGYAQALGGRLTSAIGPPDDPTTRAIAALLAQHDIPHRPWVRSDHRADWTLLVTSGPHGDKLAIGFRGCHAALEATSSLAFGDEPAPDILLVAGLSTAHSAAILGQARPETLRVLAPAIRTMRDSTPALDVLAQQIDFLSCNQAEWNTLCASAARELRARVPLIAVTEGPSGARLLLGPSEFPVPVFPRVLPPRDTNRAGEAFASTLLLRLWQSGWRRGGPLQPRESVQAAAMAAAAAAALVLDIEHFGFPTPDAIDDALRLGQIHAASSRS